MNQLFHLSICLIYVLLNINSCTQQEVPAQVNQEHWGKVNGKDVSLYTITNDNGMGMQITNYGGIITSLYVPDKDSVLEDVVCGFDNLQQYLDGHPSFGATVGRFANRIRNARFTLNDSIYQLQAGSDGHILHGGHEFETAVWDVELIQDSIGVGIRLHYFSPDGAYGFPGNINTYATYLLTPKNAIYVHYEASSDKDTHFTMTQHSYFNLAAFKEQNYDHYMRIFSDSVLLADDDAIPTGEIASTQGKAWDLSLITRIGDKIHDIPLKGYHHFYILNKDSNEMKLAASVIHPTSGRTLDVYTSEPGIVCYGSNVLGDITGKHGIAYQQHHAFCLEAQGYPDAPNQTHFKSTLLKAGERYTSTTIYDFGIVERH